MKIFEGIVESLHSMQARVVSLCFFITKAFAGDPILQAGGVPVRSVSWRPPDVDGVVLNVDGSALSNPGQTGVGGLVRNSSGEFLFGYYGSVGYSDIMHVEVVALLRGIKLCREAGYKVVVCYFDSMNTTKMVREGVAIHHREANEIQLIRNCLSRDWSVHVHHSWREGNQCANFLAKIGARSDEVLVVLNTPPIVLSPLLLADAMGVCFPHGKLPKKSRKLFFKKVGSTGQLVTPCLVFLMGYVRQVKMG